MLGTPAAARLMAGSGVTAQGWGFRGLVSGLSPFRAPDSDTAAYRADADSRGGCPDCVLSQ